MESDALTGTFDFQVDIIIKILHQVCSLSMYQSNPFVLARPWALPLALPLQPARAVPVDMADIVYTYSIGN